MCHIYKVSCRIQNLIFFVQYKFGVFFIMAYKGYTKPNPNKPLSKTKSEGLNFLKDWKNIRKRHNGQMDILNSFFNDGLKRMFFRAGRKFAKTSTMIDIAWRFANEHPKSVIYYGFPTITQAIEVVWEEKRLQYCDSKDDDMNLKYVNKTDDSKHIVTFNNGSYIKLIGTWSEARGRGTQPDLLLMDEVQDCSPAYLDAMWPNLAAKDGYCIMAGTPPPVRNHYHQWEDRFSNAKDGKGFKYSSYANTALPHLEEWLDTTKNELFKCGKQDEWFREYMAEDCFSSAQRVLPDPELEEHDALYTHVAMFQNRFSPVVGMFSHPNYFVAIYGLLGDRGEVYILDADVKKQLFDLSHRKIQEGIDEKTEEYFIRFAKRPRNLLFDPSKTIRENFSNIAEARDDLKWQDRGIPLLREMMNENKIRFSDKLGEIGVECQRLMMDEKEKDMIKNYPLICSLGMLVNEFFRKEKTTLSAPNDIDIYAPLREAGFYIPKKSNKNSLFSFNSGYQI